MGKIVWLASYPKSGNTWLRFFLYAYFNKDALTGGLDLNDPAFKAMFTQDVARDWFDDLIDKPWAEATREDFARVRMKAQEKMAAATDGLGFVKTHAYFGQNLGAPSHHPAASAGAIYVLRDPLDIALSFKAHWALTSYDKAIKRMGEEDLTLAATDALGPVAVSSWSSHALSWIGQPREGIFAVRYEDMLADPEGVFAFILSRLGQKPDKGRLRAAVEATSFKALSGAEAERGFSEARRDERTAFFRKGVAGEGRRLLSAAQIKRIQRQHGEAMKRFGYAPKP